METNTLSKMVTVTVNPELERELPPLEAERLTHLTVMIKRDGITNPIQYWFNPVTVQNEIIDGHHRYKIAQELGLPFELKEVLFPSGSITAVKYWMQVNQSARRGAGHNPKRLVELKQKFALEQGKAMSITSAVREVSKDAKVSESKVWRSLDDKPKPKVTVLDQIVKLISKLSNDDKAKLKELLE